MKNRKRKPRRIIAAVLSVVFITLMRVKKDIAAVYASMPPEHMLPLLAAAFAVTLLRSAQVPESSCLCGESH